MNDAKGYTLVEILAAVAISLVLLGAIYAAVNSVQRSSAGLERKVTAQQDVRPALELMAMEIRMASYNPNFASGVWRDTAGDCSNTAANQTYRGIQEATAGSITVEMDIDNSGIVKDHSNEIIRYAYDAGNQYITRATNCGGGQPFLGDTAASGRPRTVQVINDPAVTPVFRYYDGSGNVIAAAGLPAAIPNIRTIEITLVVQTNDIDPDTKQRRTMIYSTTVIPRNHAPAQ